MGEVLFRVDERVVGQRERVEGEGVVGVKTKVLK